MAKTSFSSGSNTTRMRFLWPIRLRMDFIWKAEATITICEFYLSFINIFFRIPYDYINRGHFTQMIWASSHKMGVGVAISYYNGRKTNACQPNRPAYMLYVVVKYDPPGNVRVKRAYLDNVLPVRRRA